MRNITAPICSLTLLSASCVESTIPPELTPQATVTYGERIYLVDDTRPPSGGTSVGDGICARLTNVLAAPAPIDQTPADLVANSTLVAADDPTGINPLSEFDAQRPQNCFIPVAAGELLVERFEVSNEQFQFCVDSGFCEDPDPSELQEGDACSSSGNDFFDCPVVDVGVSEARRYCEYIGRRLPTAIESIVIRQHAWTEDASGTRTPDGFLRFPGTNAAPQTCDDAFLGAFECGPPRAFDREATNAVGAGVSDVIEGAQGGGIFDLRGHVSEWVADGFPQQRAGLSTIVNQGLPWFCINSIGRDAQGVPTCPEISTDMDPLGPISFSCVYGYYDPDEAPPSLGLPADTSGMPKPYGLYPVCLTSPTAQFSGGNGALFGGNYLDVNPLQAQTHRRRLETSPNAPANSQDARTYGFRCVDDRESGDEAFTNGDIDIDTDFNP